MACRTFSTAEALGEAAIATLLLLTSAPPMRPPTTLPSSAWRRPTASCCPAADAAVLLSAACTPPQGLLQAGREAAMPCRPLIPWDPLASAECRMTRIMIRTRQRGVLLLGVRWIKAHRTRNALGAALGNCVVAFALDQWLDALAMGPLRRAGPVGSRDCSALLSHEVWFKRVDAACCVQWQCQPHARDREEGCLQRRRPTACAVVPWCGMLHTCCRAPGWVPLAQLARPESANSGK